MCIRDSTYTFSVKDTCNKTLSGQTYTRSGGDDTPPQITCPPDIIDACNDEGHCYAVLDVGTPEATDNCDPSPTITLERSDYLALTDPYPCGTTTITWTATDDCGNSASCIQTVKVKDCEPPVISWRSKDSEWFYAAVPWTPQLRIMLWTWFERGDAT